VDSELNTHKEAACLITKRTRDGFFCSWYPCGWPHRPFYSRRYWLMSFH